MAGMEAVDRSFATQNVLITGGPAHRFSPGPPHCEPGGKPSGQRSLLRYHQGVSDWSPRTSQEEGLRRTIDYYRQHKEHD